MPDSSFAGVRDADLLQVWTPSGKSESFTAKSEEGTEGERERAKSRTKRPMEFKRRVWFAFSGRRKAKAGSRKPTKCAE